ncbi:uncharacterized protein ACWYII_022348 [Salvelinus alpinus]
MCLSIPVLSSLHRPYKRFTPRGRAHPNLVVPARTTHVEFQVSGSLWNCRSVANKAELISAYASLQSLDFLALTETWLTTDNTATPTALSSSAHVFSHTPRASGQRGGGTGILISPKWSFSLSPLTHLSIASFEFHAVTVTSPFKLNILIIYRPPGSLGEFINELDALISSFPEDGSPLTVLDPHSFVPSPPTIHSRSIWEMKNATNDRQQMHCGPSSPVNCRRRCSAHRTAPPHGSQARPLPPVGRVGLHGARPLLPSPLAPPPGAREGLGCSQHRCGPLGLLPAPGDGRCWGNGRHERAGGSSGEGGLVVIGYGGGVCAAGVCVSGSGGR